VQDYERTQSSLERMEQKERGGLDDESEIEAARVMTSEALAAMEVCLKQRAKRSEDFEEVSSLEICF
jgi:hypothetical protein